MKSAFLTLLSITHAIAGTAPITWDDQVAAKFEVWRGLELIASVTTNEAAVDLPDDQVSSLVVIAINAVGERSEPSPALHILPLKPQAALDLEAWETGPTFFLTLPSAEIPAKAFFRAAYPAISTP